MKTFRRFGLLVICAAIGVGWAVIVGICSTPTNDPIKSSKTALAAVTPVVEATKRQQDAIPSLLPLSPESVVTLPPPPAEPIGPVIAQPHPIMAQEYVPPPPPEPEGTSSSKSTLPDIMKLLKDRLAAPAPAMGRTSSSPVTSQAYQAPIKSTIKGEGDGKLRIHIYDEDIRKVLDLLSEQGNLNILASKSVEGKVSATLNGVDIDSALDAILKSTGYVAKREGNYVFVGTPGGFQQFGAVVG